MEVFIRCSITQLKNTWAIPTGRGLDRINVLPKCLPSYKINKECKEFSLKIMSVDERADKNKINDTLEALGAKN